jgi:hypothetical protein
MGERTMNDEFLYKLRRLPRSEFAEALYERISPERKKTMLRVVTMKRLALGLTALCLMFAAVFFASPTARAQVVELIRTITIGKVDYVDQSSMDEFYEEHGDQGETEMLEQTLSLAEAQTMLSFPLAVPTWVPEGYVLEDNVMVKQSLPSECFYMASADLTWKNSSGGVISLHVWYPAEVEGENAVTVFTDLEGVEVTEVNGQPAGLFRRGWDTETKQEDAALKPVSLSWSQGNALYILGTAYVSADDLIQMAESMQ